MANTIYANMPIATCPHCKREFQWDDYYDLHIGSERDCPSCERAIHVIEVDTVIVALLSTEISA